MTKTRIIANNMLVGEVRNLRHPVTNMAGMDYPDSGTIPGAHSKPRRSSIVRAPEPEAPGHVVVEPEYYMSNYEATVTVHKSPPMARRPTFEFLEIDDETRDFPALGLHRKKAPKKNLKVTFSDHIDVDIISLLEDSDDSDNDPSQDMSVDLLDPWNDSPSETHRSLGSPEPSKPTNRRARPSPAQSWKPDGPREVSPGRNLHTSPNYSDSKGSVKSPLSQSQPLLQRRKHVSKPSLVSDVVHKKIVALSENPSLPNTANSTAKRFSRSVFPDIVSSLRSDKPTVSGVKRVDASASSRSYERPWLTNSTSTPSYAQNMRLIRHKSASEHTNVHRTSSLPKNFKLPENLSASRFGKGMMDSPRSIRS